MVYTLNVLVGKRNIGEQYRGRENLEEARNWGQIFQKIKDNNASIREEMFLKGL